MTRVFAYGVAALMVLGGGLVQAQEMDSRSLFSGGPNFFSGGGSSPIPRTTVSFDGSYAPGTMEGGPTNPLGARAMYLGSTLYRIHGSNEPETIGQAVSSGCFRMTNDDVTDLYGRVSVGTTVVVKN